MTLVSGTCLGRYEIGMFLGAGGMGEVYRAWDRQLARDVAVKILPANASGSASRRARFKREAEAISRLAHGNICAVYDAGEQDGIAYLVMEYIPGESLETRLLGGALPWTTAVQIAIQIAAAIDAAHRNGIVHRDLKPANVMLTGNRVKLLDFGVAKIVEDADAEPASDVLTAGTLTAEHQVVGTVNYMAPEQLERRAVDGRADIFALGAVLYEMLTGHKAFGGTSIASITAAVMMIDPPPVSSTDTERSSLPPSIDHILRRALAKDRDARWQTARDLMHELQWQIDRPTTDQTTTLATSRTLRPWPWIALTASIVAAAIAGDDWLRAHTPPAARFVAPMTIIFTLTPPEGTQFASGFDIAAVSPDGHKIAFLAGPEANPSIWVRYVEGLASTLMESTEGAHAPFWSPNSQSIGYYAKGAIQRLKVVTAGGHTFNAPREVVQVGAPSQKGYTTSAAWMSDDTIIYAEPNGLFRVSADSGTPSKITVVDKNRDEVSHLLPTALSNGRFLYLMKSLSEKFEARVTDSAQGPTLNVPTVQSNAVFVSGYLLFRQGDALVAQPFDEQHARLTGTPTILAERVSYDLGNARTAFSASSEVLVYRSEKPRELTRVHRNGTRAGTLGERARNSNPMVAPDGSGRIAVDRFDPVTGRSDVWVIDAKGRATPLSQGLASRFPVWSPDGQYLLYSAKSENGDELHRVRASGKDDEVLYRAERIVPLDWTRDGRSIFASGYPLNNDLWALTVDDKKAKPIPITTGDADDKTARVSPDGRWIAYSSHEGTPVTQPGNTQAPAEIWIRDFAGANKRRITFDGGFDPSWRQDGLELYYVTMNGRVMAVPIQLPDSTTHALKTGPPVALFTINADGIQQLFHVFAVSPDGQEFVVSEPSGGPDQLTVMVNWMARLKAPYPQ
jgi:serine/threonine protein kinase